MVKEECERKEKIERAEYKKNIVETKLENMGIQGIMMEFIRKLISERWIKARMEGYISQSKQRDLGIPQGWVLSLTFFLVAINGILRKLRNGEDGSLFADDLAIYITTKSKRVASRTLQGVTNKLHGQQRGA